MYGFALTQAGENEQESQLARFIELEETKDAAFTAVRDYLAAQSVDGERGEAIRNDVEEWLADLTVSGINHYNRASLEAYDLATHLFTLRIEGI